MSETYAENIFEAEALIYLAYFQVDTTFFKVKGIIASNRYVSIKSTLLWREEYERSAPDFL